MEQILSVAQSITTIVGAVLSILWLVAMVYVIILCGKFNHLIKQVNHTADSVQQLSQFPLQVVNSLIQKFVWWPDQPTT
jgi:hypothetical protein